MYLGMKRRVTLSVRRLKEPTSEADARVASTTSTLGEVDTTMISSHYLLHVTHPCSPSIYLVLLFSPHMDWKIKKN